MKQVAVIGAGVAGLTCARVLRRGGFYVDIFEKDRTIGGRTATTRIGMTTFDHGAQYVTARSSRFEAFLKELAGTGYATRWSPKSCDGDNATQQSPWFVGTPGMSSIVRPLAESVRIHNDREVHTIVRNDKGWYLWFTDKSSLGPFSAVAVATPVRDARLLLGRMPDIVDRMAPVRMLPCWALMIKLDERTLPDRDVYSDMSDVIRWIARNNSKPGRGSKGDHVVVHASPAWSREAEDADPEVVASEMWAEVSHLLSLGPVRPSHMSANLWRDGLVDASLGKSFIFSTEHMVGACGDWCLGRLVEHAFDSGLGLGNAVVGALT